MAPSAIDEPAVARADTKTYPPAKIFPVKETRFEKYYEPQPDGRKKALSQSGSPAIVIDNGEGEIAPAEPPLMIQQLTNPRGQVLIMSELDGASSRSLASVYHRSWPNIATAS